MKRFYLVLLALLPLSINVQASVYFQGQHGSYAASDGHLGGGVESLPAWSMEFWIRPDSTAVRQGLFDIHGDWKQTSLTIGDGGTIGGLTIWPQTYYSTSSDPGVITANEWQLLGFVSDGQKLSIYRNGQAVASGGVSAQTFIAGEIAGDVSGNFNFGFSDYQTVADGSFYQGFMADFRLWDRALSQSELAQHVTRQPGVNADDLLNWIPFNETSGDIFHDVVGGADGRYYNVLLSDNSPIQPVPESGQSGLLASAFCFLLILPYLLRRSEKKAA